MLGLQFCFLWHFWRRLVWTILQGNKDAQTWLSKYFAYEFKLSKKVSVSYEISVMLGILKQLKKELCCVASKNLFWFFKFSTWSPLRKYNVGFRNSSKEDTGKALRSANNRTRDILVNGSRCLADTDKVGNGETSTPSCDWRPTRWLLALTGSILSTELGLELKYDFKV